MLILVMRGSSGVTGFVRNADPLNRSHTWQCVGIDRSHFARPMTIDEVVPAMSALVQHAATHVGPIQQVIEIDA